MIIVYGIIIIVGLVLCYLWAKVVFALFGYFNRKRNSNLYIQTEKLKIKNDRDYEAYLKWMDKQGNGVPMEKLKTREEHIADNKISDLIR
jgi:FtsZ-interacting cell division protein ZipA